MTGGSIFDRVAALEAAARVAGDDLRDRLARCEAVIAAQADLIALFLSRVPVDPGFQLALEVVRHSSEAGPAALPLPELRAMLAVAVPVIAARGVALDDLRGPRRTQGLVEARWAVARALAAVGHSRERIARFLRRDVSTVGHGLRQEWRG